MIAAGLLLRAHKAFYEVVLKRFHFIEGEGKEGRRSLEISIFTDYLPPLGTTGVSSLSVRGMLDM